MTTQGEDYRPDKPPIEEMWDVLIHAQSAQVRHSDAYYFAGLQGMEIVAEHLKEQPDNPELLEDLKYWVAFEQFIGTSLRDVGLLSPAEFDRHADYYEKMQSGIVEGGVEVGIVGTVGAIKELEAGEVWDHFYEQLEEYHDVLTGLRTFPESSYAASKANDPGHFAQLAEALWVLNFFSPGRDVFEKLITNDALEQRISMFAELFLRANKVGLGILYGSMLLDSQYTPAFLEQLVEKLQQIRGVEGDDSFRRIYNYATRTLRLSTKARFIERLPKEATPLIFGSEVVTLDNDRAILSERFEEGELVWAALSDGVKIPLPYIYYRHRTILGYNTDSESEIYEAQTSVAYDSLPDDAKAAVETAIRVADRELTRTETLPFYKRLAFWHDESGDRLYTTIFRDGYGRIMDRYPDHHGFVTSDPERKLDFPVKRAQEVKDGYLVVPYDGSYMVMQTFLDAEPNFFGPGEEYANAFWIMGNARKIFSETDQGVMSETEYGPRSRFVIVPVRYYKIIEDKIAPDPKTGNEEEEFFTNLSLKTPSSDRSRAEGMLSELQ